MRKLLVILVLSVACSTSPYRKDDTIDRELAAVTGACLDRAGDHPKEPLYTSPFFPGRQTAAWERRFDMCMRAHGYSR